MTNTHTQNEKQESGGMNRRGFMRKSVAGATAVGAVSYGSLRLDHGPVQSAQANPALIGAGIVFGAGAVGGWLLREIDPLGMDTVPSGLSRDAFFVQAVEKMIARKSNIESTIIDNENIIEGVRNLLWEEGKIRAIEELESGSDSQTAADKGVEEMDEYVSTIIKNILRTYNEAVAEWNGITSYDGLGSETNYFESDYAMATRGGDNDAHGTEHPSSDWWITPQVQNSGDSSLFEPGPDETFDYELPNGEFFEIKAHPHKENGPSYPLNRSSYENDTLWVEPSDYSHPETEEEGINDGSDLIENPFSDDDAFGYCSSRRFENLVEIILDILQDVSNGLILWTDEVAQAVEDGELDSSDLLSSRDISNMLSDDESTPNAIADLSALNIAVEPDREALIETQDENGDTFQALGFLSYTGSDELAVGEVNPDEKDGVIYFTSDISEEGEPTEYENFALSEPFEILEFSDGSTETEFSRREAHDDTNYITQEEWEEYQQTHQNIIDQYLQDEGGVAAGSFADGAEGFLSSEIYGIPVIGWLIGLAGAGILFGGND